MCFHAILKFAGSQRRLWSSPKYEKEESQSDLPQRSMKFQYPIKQVSKEVFQTLIYYIYHVNAC